ncbi:MAG: hypothetical protein KC462_08850, partial [Cyanobacteria bacterium HKST-UBA05]|nr:hypothetical protein [Cyanobacteria bacterium HKST-UBA05]
MPHFVGTGRLPRPALFTPPKPLSPGGSVPLSARHASPLSRHACLPAFGKIDMPRYMVLTEQDAKPQGTPLVLNWYANHLHIPHAPSASVVLSHASPDKHDFLNTNAFSRRHVSPRQTNAMWLSNWAIQGFDPVNFPLIFSQLFTRAIAQSEAKGYKG